MFIEGLFFTRAAIHVTKVKNKVLAPIIVILCVIGAFAINNSMFDVAVMFMFGILGYFMDKIGMPTAPMVVGLILGQMLDTSLHQSLKIGHGSLMIFYDNTICFWLLVLSGLSILQATPFFGHCKRLLQKSQPE
jgi:putative tricarboxylic transport membrane protein